MRARVKGRRLLTTTTLAWEAVGFAVAPGRSDTSKTGLRFGSPDPTAELSLARDRRGVRFRQIVRSQGNQKCRPWTGVFTPPIVAVISLAGLRPASHSKSLTLWIQRVSCPTRGEDSTEGATQVAGSRPASATRPCGRKCTTSLRIEGEKYEEAPTIKGGFDPGAVEGLRCESNTLVVSPNRCQGAILTVLLPPACEPPARARQKRHRLGARTSVAELVNGSERCARCARLSRFADFSSANDLR